LVGASRCSSSVMPAATQTCNVAACPPPATCGSVYIESAAVPGYCIDIFGGALTAGTVVSLWRCNRDSTSPSQSWTLYSDGTFRPSQASTLCLTIKKTSYNTWPVGQPMQIAACGSSAADNQRFYSPGCPSNTNPSGLYVLSSGWSQLIDIQRPLVVSSTETEVYDGNALVLSTPTLDTQEWFLRSLTIPATAPVAAFAPSPVPAFTSTSKLTAQEKSETASGWRR
jgi:hypothetical protein